MAVASADTAAEAQSATGTDQGGTSAESATVGTPSPESPATTVAGADTDRSGGGLTPDVGATRHDSGNPAAGTAAVATGSPGTSEAISERIAARVSDTLSPAPATQPGPLETVALDAAGPQATPQSTVISPAPAAAQTATAVPAPAARVDALAVDRAAGASGSGPAESSAAVDLIALIWTSLVNAANTSTNPANKSPVTPMAVAAPTALLGAGMLSVPLTLEPELTPAPPADAMTPLLLSSANATTDGPERLSGGGWLAYLATQISLGVREALRNVSVTELALAALPGLVGLLFFFASGVGLGRRQARFGFALQSTGAIRFAARGPLGVVRSGTMVSVRVRGASDTSRPRLALKAVSTAA
ncbi:MAG: hypothetical protein ACKOB8_05120 [Mycobacterium sp.]